MPIRRLDHYSIRTAKVDETRHFYVEIMGFEDGARPPFKFPGAWLYADGMAVVHIVGIDPDDRSGLTEYLGDRSAAALAGTGTIDHVAFTASGLAAMLDRLRTAQIAHRERTVPDLGLHQVFIEDPNGITIELNYAAAEAQRAA